MLTELIKQAPSLAVLCFIVLTFVRYLRHRDEAIRDIHSEHMDERRQARVTMEANTSAMAKNTMALGQLSTKLKE